MKFKTRQVNVYFILTGGTDRFVWIPLGSCGTNPLGLSLAGPKFEDVFSYDWALDGWFC